MSVRLQGSIHQHEDATTRLRHTALGATDGRVIITAAAATTAPVAAAPPSSPTPPPAAGRSRRVGVTAHPATAAHTGHSDATTVRGGLARLREERAQTVQRLRSVAAAQQFSEQTRERRAAAQRAAAQRCEEEGAREAGAAPAAAVRSPPATPQHHLARPTATWPGP